MRPGRGNTESGFSLMELMVALTILALAMTVVSMGLTRRSPGFELRRAAADVTALMREARASAREQNRAIEVVFRADERRFETSGGRSVDVSGQIRASLVSSAAAGQPGVIFLPDGSSTGGQVTLEVSGVAERIEVDWLTSRIERERLP